MSVKMQCMFLSLKAENASRMFFLSCTELSLAGAVTPVKGNHCKALMLQYLNINKHNRQMTSQRVVWQYFFQENRNESFLSVNWHKTLFRLKVLVLFILEVTEVGKLI